MNFNTYIAVLVALLFNLLSLSFAKDATQISTDNILLSEEAGIKKQIQQKLAKLDGKLEVDFIENSPIVGIYSVMLKSGQTIYSDKDAGHIITGEMLSLSEDGIKNLTAISVSKYVSKQLKIIDNEEVIRYRPADNTKATIYVFTDVNCSYCRKFHKDIAKLNEMQIEVNVLAFPRKRQPSIEYQSLVNIWSANNPKFALEQAMDGKKIPQAQMSSSSKAQSIVEKQLALGLRFGITGTPAIILENGEIIAGYAPPEVIAKRLNVVK